MNLDGRFKIAPTIVRQSYTLHSRYEGQRTPLGYFRLPDEETVTYIRIFKPPSHAGTRGLVFRPAEFHLDCEKAALTALNECCRRAELKGCSDSLNSSHEAYLQLSRFNERVLQRWLEDGEGIRGSDGISTTNDENNSIDEMVGGGDFAG